MRFMMLMIPRGYETAPAGAMPEADRVAEMMKYNEELQKAGVLVTLDGLHPPAMGARVSFTNGRPMVTDGPFAEAKEVLGGYWMINVKSREEAVQWASRCPASANEIIEVRQVQEFEDFPEDVQKAAAGFAEMHTGSAHPTRMFVNLPVKDMDRSMAFFKALGYRFNPQFTNQHGACMIVGDNIFVMLLVEPFFTKFTPRAVADAKSATEVLVALSMPSREHVDRIVGTALEAGAQRIREPEDHGFMYQWAFADLDGHIWEYFWMDPAHVQPSVE